MQLLSLFIRIPASDIEDIIDFVIKFIKSENFLPSVLNFLKLAGVSMFIVIVFFTILFLLPFASNENNQTAEGSELENKQEINNTQDWATISDSKTKKAIAQTAKAIAETYLQETPETQEKSDRKSRLLGRTARSLTKKYLDENKQ